MSTLSREHQVLIAGAVGDAFGYMIEFHDWPRIKAEFGAAGFTFKQFELENTWVVSDDTQMSLFTYEAIHQPPAKNSNVITQFLTRIGVASQEQVHQRLITAYKAWFITQNRTPHQLSMTEHAMSRLLSHAELFEQRAPGMTCLSALQQDSYGTMHKPKNNSKGCGGVMRAGPAGMYAATIEQAFLLGCTQAVITHGHEDGVLSSGWFAGLICVLLGMEQQVLTPEVMKFAVDLTYRAGTNVLTGYEQYLPAHEVMYSKCLKAIDTNKLSPTELVKQLGEGWVGDEALYVAIHAATHGESFEDMLWISANHSGDSDSTATLAAQLWVAISGLDDAVMENVTKLDVYPVIASLIVNSGI